LPDTVESTRQITVTTPTGESATFTVERSAGRVSIGSQSSKSWSASAANGQAVSAQSGKAEIRA